MTEGRRLYIGGLPYRTTEDDLRDLVDKYGRIEDAFIVLDKDSAERRSRGYGFVTFEDKCDADDCAQALHKTNYEGRTLIVEMARAAGSNRGGRRDGGGGRRDGGYGGGRDRDRGYGGGRDRGYGGGGGRDRGYGGGRDRDGGYGRDDYRGGGGRY